ncbi:MULTISPECIES: DotI/IcmL family type IV secretion protein [Agrobacterium]|uniref:DotI/IcmL family type IV secretion protein n=3 Tax=Hyphomicrobiales TaxID=356 RepID=UPI0015628FB3|nr:MULTISPECIES: DotI/IcmL family type IV secretion protein [Agrobacterium]MCQ9147393.1 DotI/IcmL family type IV secretion protein [Ochrobactrum sp. BTU2]MDH1270289.1 DotI/IcmL family type IV secretion protein [Agrobacterium pusense]
MKTKEEILEASAAQSAIQRNMKVFIVLLVIGNAVMALHVGQLLYARFVKFPDTAFLGTTDAQSVCAPIGLDEPMVADAVARDFAVEAIRAISTYDWTSWRDQINSSTAQYMTLDARNSYRISVNDWGIIRDVVNRYQNATAQQRGPATVQRQGVVRQQDGTGRYEWEIVVPMTLIYRNATDRRTENRDFYAKVIRTAKSPLNPKGIAIGGLVSSQPVQVNNLQTNAAVGSVGQ